MKLRTLVLLLVSSVFSHASPFLVCDPVPTGQANTPASYTVTGLGSTVTTSPAVTITANTVQLHLDLASVANGTYTVTATATNSAGTSLASNAFTFTLPLPVTPAAPTGLKVVPN